MNMTSKSAQLLQRTSPLLSTVVLILCTALGARQGEPLYFDVEDLGEPNASVAVIEPWEVVQLEVDYGGQWVVAADLDGDRTPEIVSCENVNQGDVHCTSTAVA